MKILMINNFFSSFGGAENVMCKEADLLEDKGNEVYFFSTDKKPFFIKNYEYGEYFAKYKDYNNLNASEVLGNIIDILYNFGAQKRLNSLLSRIKPDIVHCHNISHHLSVSVIDSCHKNHIPIVMTLHDARLFCPAGTMMRNSVEYCHSQECLTGNYLPCVINKCKNSNLQQSFLVLAENIINKRMGIYEKIDKFIAPTNAMAKIAYKAGISDKKLSILNNFVDDNYLQENPNYENQGYFLYAGRISKEKGIDILLKAMKFIPEIKLKIAGAGKETEEYRNLAQEMELKNVEFLGFKNEKELKELYNGCTALILPSNWFENCPISILEAFAIGKPVIASKIGGIPELVENGQNGLLFLPSKEHELACCMQYLQFKPHIVEKLGKNARKKAEELYNSKIHVNRLLKIYNQTINDFELKLRGISV
ncbi:MAG: glycosyltransferase [Candidatus Gastranaerophilales bacterium]|nr:glycosyltransferase [Candidatus Gastranaerophilales bacterium]